MKYRTPKLPLASALDKALLILEKEGTNPISLDVFAHHFGYTNAKNGAAKTVIAALRAYGMIIKSSDKKERITDEVKKYHYTPYPEQKNLLLSNWLHKPEIFAYFLKNGIDNLPSEEAIIYELIDTFNLSEPHSRSVYISFKDSISFVKSTTSNITPSSDEEISTGITIDHEEIIDDLFPEEVKVIETMQPEDAVSAAKIEQSTDETSVTETIESTKEAKLTETVPSSLTETFSIHIKAPGIDTHIEIEGKDDIPIIEATLKRIYKKLEHRST